MQTFLPYPDFRQSAAVLDKPRLGKQRVETLQSLRALVIPDYGWQSHPAIRMWMGYVPALTVYGLAMVDEWTARGGADSTRANILEFAPEAAQAWEVLANGGSPEDAGIAFPPWLGDPQLHLSHRSKLISKDSRFYTSLFPGTPPDLDYVWPEPERVLLPEEPSGDRVWVLRMPFPDIEPEHLDIVSLPPHVRPQAPRSAADADPGDPDALELPPSGLPSKHGPKVTPKQLVKRPSRKRQRQEDAFATLPSGSLLAIPVDGGTTFAAGAVRGRPFELDDGRPARKIHITEILDRSAFDYPALLQDPRLFFPVPAP
jgi:hypothetical protein